MKLKHIILIILSILAVIVLFKLAEPHNTAYNKHMCAVYGYKADCKTALPESERLK